MSENDAFEAWARTRGWSLFERYVGDYGSLKDGEYKHPTVHSSYIAWAACAAAKDAEIAELRARLVECEEAVDQAVELADYLEGHSKGAMAERVKTALSAKFAQERKRERDEARECARRLHSVCSELLKLESGCGFVCAHSLEELERAIASTPEHLR